CPFHAGSGRGPRPAARSPPPPRVLTPPSPTVFLDREPADAVAQLGERDARRARRLGQQAGRRHARQRVDLEAPEGAIRVHPEVYPAVARELQRTVRFQRQELDLAGLLILQDGREDLLRHAVLVLALVIE